MNTIAKPFGLLLMWLYEVTTNYGLAVILFSLIVKLILLPFMMKSKRGTLKMTRLSGKVKELEKRHGANQQKYNEEVQKLYKSENVNPASGCLWTLLPWPILIALYYAIRQPITTMMGVPAELLKEGGSIFQKLTSMGFNFDSAKAGYLEIAQSKFISENWGAFSSLSEKLRQVNYSFLGMDMSAMPNWKVWEYGNYAEGELLPAIGLFMIPVLAALLTWATSKISMKLNPQSQAEGAGTMGAMMTIMPIMTLVFAFLMPAALGIYWIASSFFGIIQDVVLTKHYTKILDAEDAERITAEKEKEEALEEKRRATAALKAENATVENPNTSKRKKQKRLAQEAEEKANEWERKQADKGESEEETPSQVGARLYARGRAYDPDRYARPDEAEDEEAVESEEAEEAETVAGAESEDMPAEEESGDNKEQ